MPRLHAPWMSRMTASPLAVSSAPEGSSASSSWWSPTTARAMATRCRSPPESWSGKLAARSARPSPSSAFRLATRALRAGVPSSSSGSATFSAAVSPGRRLKSWNTKPMERRRSRALALRDILVSSCPQTQTSPLLGSSRLPAMVSRVDLPEPLGPMTATIAPASTRRSIPSSACTSVAP